MKIYEEHKNEESIEEKFDLEFYAYDNKLKTNILEDIVLQKYNKLYWNVKTELSSKIVNSDASANYDLYYRIIQIIHDNINILYNNLLTIKESNIYKENKSKFINIIKFETKRLAKIQNNIKNIGNNTIEPNYINNIISLYNIDDETSVYLVFSNIHNELRKIYFDSVSNKKEIDIKFLVNKLLEKYDLEEELKIRILNFYEKEEPIEDPKIINFVEFKLKKYNI